MPLADFKTEAGLWAMSKQINGVQIHTKAKTLWKDIKNRCRPGSYMQEKFPTYIGCSISENFQNFQFFAEWCNNQIGYALKGYHIDKDILVDGNKLYSEQTCVFVPAALNYFLCGADALRTNLPKGVHFNERLGKFKATISIDNKTVNLGLFNSSEEAEAAYKTAKRDAAILWVKKIKEFSLPIDKRVIERLENWSAV